MPRDWKIVVYVLVAFAVWEFFLRERIGGLTGR